jgi:hypothetical protein
MDAYEQALMQNEKCALFRIVGNRLRKGWEVTIWTTDDLMPGVQREADTKLAAMESALWQAFVEGVK